MKRIGFLLLALVFFMFPHPYVLTEANYSNGILVYPQEAIQTVEDVDAIITSCNEYGISTIFLKVKQDTGPESGVIYFDNSRAPRKSNFDILDEITEKAGTDIDVYAWLPVLYDGNLASRNMRIKDNWICPLKAQSFYEEVVRNLTNYKIKGIIFDYLQFPDDISASEQMIDDFGIKYNKDMSKVFLQTEKEQNSKLWQQWTQYREEVLLTFLNNIIPDSNKKNMGIFVRSEDIEEYSESSLNTTHGSRPLLFDAVDFVAAPADKDPVSQANKLSLLTESDICLVIPNHYISEVRTLLRKSTYADFLLFDSQIWTKSEFQRIRKAKNPLSDIRMTEMSFINFFNGEYDMESWTTSEANTAVFPAGHAFSTYFKFQPYQEKWSHYIQKYNRDYVQEMISQADEAALYAVLELDVQSEEFVIRNKDAASVTYQWGTNRKRICLTELTSDPYKTEFFQTASFLAENYDSEAILITNIAYLEDCFCTKCLESYIDFMAQRGVPVEDWPRRDGEIDIYDQTVREWKTAQITTFLEDLRENLRGSNKELWVKVPVSSNLEYTSSEYGLNLSELESIVDRVVLINITIETPGRIQYIVNSLPTPSMYILNFFVPYNEAPARTYLVDSLRKAYDADVESVGIYPQSVLNVNLWAAFYNTYAYKLAMGNDYLKDLYEQEKFNKIIEDYPSIVAEKKEEEKQHRNDALKSIREAERTQRRMYPALQEAKQMDLNIDTMETEKEENDKLLSEAKNLFIEEEYQQAEQKGKTAAVEFSILHAKLENRLYKEWIKRITAGVIIIVVFLFVMMYVRFIMHRRE